MDIQRYKRSHRPKVISEGGPHQGIYIPKNPGKVIGGEIITRSSWEMAFARWCDTNPAVVEWGCETACIQYRNPAALNLAKCREHNVDPMNPANWPINNYYPDFYIKLENKLEDGTCTYKKIMIEIKPKYQTERPVPPPADAKGPAIKRFNELTKTYLQNVKKWEAAKLWCDTHGVEFRVFTEDTLQKLGLIG